MLGVFPFVIMFLITSITTLRERTTTTLERLMTMPLARLDLAAHDHLLDRADRLVRDGAAPSDCLELHPAPPRRSLVARPPVHF